jgi:hypothetical protein
MLGIEMSREILNIHASSISKVFTILSIPHILDSDCYNVSGAGRGVLQAKSLRIVSLSLSSWTSFILLALIDRFSSFHQPKYL